MAVAAEEGRERADLHYLVEVVCLSVLASCCDPTPPLRSLSIIYCLSLCLSLSVAALNCLGPQHP